MVGVRPAAVTAVGHRQAEDETVRDRDEQRAAAAGNRSDEKVPRVVRTHPRARSVPREPDEVDAVDESRLRVH